MVSVGEVTEVSDLSDMGWGGEGGREERCCSPPYRCAIMQGPAWSSPSSPSVIWSNLIFWGLSLGQAL